MTPAAADFDVVLPLLGPVSHKVLVEFALAAEAFAFVGAVAGGLEARARKREVVELNGRLRRVNEKLRLDAQRASHAAEVGGTGGSRHTTYNWERSEVLDLLRDGKAALRDRRPDAAEVAFRTALAEVERAGDMLDCPLKARRKAYRGISAAKQQMGHFEDALEPTLEVYRISVELGEDVGEACGLVADLYTEMGRFADAADWYDKYLTSEE